MRHFLRFAAPWTRPLGGQAGLGDVAMQYFNKVFAFKSFCFTVLILGIVLGPRSAWAEDSTVSQPALEPRTAFASIEVGSSGVRAVIYDLNTDDVGAIMAFDQDDLEVRYQALADRMISRPASVETNALYEENILSTANAVRALVSEARLEHDVAREHVFVAMDSGIASAPHAQSLANAIARRSGVQPDMMTPGREAALAFKWVTPRGRVDQAVYVDVGSANITAAFQTDDGVIEGAEIMAHGSKSLLNVVLEAYRGVPPSDIDQAIATLAGALVEAQIAAAMQAHPELASRPRVYLAGGASWALTTLTRPETVREDWPRVGRRHVRAFVGHSAEAPRHRREALSWIANEDLRQDASDAMAAVHDVFAPDQMMAAAHVLDSLWAALALDDRDAVFFARQGYRGWSSQYLMERAEIIFSASEAGPLATVTAQPAVWLASP